MAVQVVIERTGMCQSKLSQPFRGDELGCQPELAASEILVALDQLQTCDSGSFVAYSGERLPW